MNLKKSKFFKRLQMMRLISKEKLRKERERLLVEYHLENAFCEKSGSTSLQQNTADNQEENSAQKFDNISIKKFKNKNNLKCQQRNFSNQQNENAATSGADGDQVNGLIHLNNKCYKIKCLVASYGKSGAVSTKSVSSVRKTRGSICVRNSRYNLIGRVAKSLGFRVANESQLWNIMWTDTLPGVEIYKNMKRFQQINHFPGMMEICRKDLLSRNLNRMLKLYPKDYKIFPKTWMFPADYGEAMNYANSSSKQKMFILKPDSGARGRGIWLTNDLKTISPTERMICQIYIRRPLLMDGYKFDLRIYALITSIDPLRIFVYNEGLARLATNKYVEPSTNNSTDLYMHLTNYSLNKRNSQYEMCESDDCGSKRNFKAINNWLRYKNCDVQEFWNKIDDIIIKTVLSAWPILKHSYHACFPAHDRIHACFEILGFDILVDSKMRPYILEVNHSPSFHTNEVVDQQVKKPLIRDTLSLVGALLADKRQILREDRKRVKQRLLTFKLGNLSQRSTAVKHSPSAEIVTSEANIKDSISGMSQQVDWEETHLGNYRCIMPPNDPVKLNYYLQFHDEQNEASIFAQTAASKKREEVAKKLRKELEERKLKQTEMLRRKLFAVNFEQRQRKRSTIPRITIEKQRQDMMRLQAYWSPCFVSPAEERLRVADMLMRAEMLQELKVAETIYELFYNSNNLNKSDITKFPHLYRRLEGGIKITIDQPPA